MGNWGEIGQSLEATSKSNLIFIVCLWRFLPLTHFMRRVSFDTPLWCFQGVSKPVTWKCFNCDENFCFYRRISNSIVMNKPVSRRCSWRNVSLKNSQNSQKIIIHVVVDFSQNIWQLLHEIFKITLFQKKKRKKKKKENFTCFLKKARFLLVP